MKPWRRWLAVALIILGAAPLPSVTSAQEPWGPFRGQVVDLETGQPIEGAVALALWWRIEPTPVQGIHHFYDAKEAVTGQDGRFDIPRLSVPPWHLGVQPGGVTVFAPGHMWKATLITPPNGQEFVDPTIVQMQRLKTEQERRHAIWNSHLPPGGVPHEKMPNLLRALNRELSGKETEPYSLGGAK